MKAELNVAAAVGSYSFTILLVVMGVVVAAVFIWAVAFRKPDDGRGHHRRHHWRSHKSRDSKPEEGQKSRGWFGSKRRRRRKRKERPTNPTLAETGGLPPMRSEDPGPPSQN